MRISVDPTRIVQALGNLINNAAKYTNPGGHVHVLAGLDERGDIIDSTVFARHLGRWRDQSVANTIFVIGGADGLLPDLRRKAKLSIAFGSATWPHQLVRIMLLEQIYRAATILAGHPYHRA